MVRNMQLMSWTGTVACVTSIALLALSWNHVADAQSPTVLQPEQVSDNVGGRQEAESVPHESSPVDNQSQFHVSPVTIDGDRFLVVLSTMDGYVTALNGATGAKEWSISTGPTPLLSSSISKLEMTRGGKMARLIPSLDGGLYQFDGESIEPIPLAADILLSNSFRFSDDSTIVGAKELETYGIDLSTGTVRYVCSSAGCKYSNSGSENVAGAADSSSADDILIVTRSTKTVRTVEMQTGHERWNFSVSQHDVAYVSRVARETVESNPVSPVAPTGSCWSRPPGNPLSVNVDGSMDTDSPSTESTAAGRSSSKRATEAMADESTDQCIIETEDMEGEDETLSSGSVWTQQHEQQQQQQQRHHHQQQQHTAAVGDLELKVIVPNGHVVAVDRQSSGHVFWQHKCSSAVAGAWILRNRKLSSVSLFDDRNVPALQQDDLTSEDADEDASVRNDVVDFGEPLLYIGLFQDQLYIQPSVQMLQDVEAASSAALIRGNINMPRVRWLPYLATAMSRTPAASNPNKVPQIGYETNPSSTAVVQWHEQYPFDGGYYLYPEFLSFEPDQVSLNSTEPEDSDITVSLLNWWKEVLGISVLMSAVVNVVVLRCLGRRNAIKDALLPVNTPGSPVDAISSAVEPTSTTSSDDKKSDDSNSTLCKPPDFISRYLTDFHQDACLGRGGFGVVFRARNQLDDCVYAVKRIALHDSDRAREKVTREVKALAKLEHPGIVRYYQSWFECPPPGWQEERDRLSIDLSTTSPSAVGLSPMDSLSVPSRLNHSRPPPILRKLADLRSTSGSLSQHKGLNPLKPFGSGVMSNGIEMESTTNKSEQSDEDNEDDSSLDQSETHHDGLVKRISADSGTENDSFEISFRDDSRLVDSGGGDVKDLSTNPENRHGKHIITESSFSIVFEDDVANNRTDIKPATENRSVIIDNLSSSSSAVASRPQTLELTRNQPTSVASVSTPSTSIRKLYLYIQMQLCQEESLKDWLANNTLNRDKCKLLDIFHQIVSAIGYVHDCGLMHRDLKPSNIFFAMDGSVKIGDFGLVTAVEENCSDSSYIFSPDVASGRANSPDAAGRHTNQVGTKLYMSPEQCVGRNYTHKVDIYAIGMIFFELFYPFATEMERIQTLLGVRNLTFPQRFLRELSEEAKFVRPLLSHDPNARPSTKEILADPLVVDFEEASQAYRRLHSQCRGRTVSNSSANSAGEPASGCTASTHRLAN